MEKLNPSHNPMDNEPAQPEKKPLSLKELLLIILSGHIGVRTREQRAEDFDRANGLHVFFAAATYFALIVTGLICFVIYIAG